MSTALYETIPVEKFLVKTREQFEAVLSRIRQATDLVVDTETTGLRAWHGDRLCGVGVAVSGEEGWYMPFRHDPWENLPLGWLPDLWDAVYECDRVVGWNLKFDLAMMHQDGFVIDPGHKMADMIVGARLCSADRYPNLSLSGQLDEQMGPGSSEYEKVLKAYLRKNKWSKTYHKAPPEILGEYCVKDVLGTWALKEIFEDYIEATNQSYVWEQEQEVTDTLWDMERDGLGYDEEYGAQKIPQLKARIQSLYNEVYELAGEEFNLNSNPQLTKVMNQLGIYSPQKSVKTGKDGWGVGVMLSIDHPIAGRIIEIRTLEKLLGTYFEGIVDWPGGTVHSFFKNWGAITGRMSCVDPNLQNIAKTVQNLLGNEMNEETLAALSVFFGAKQGGGYTQMESSSGNTVGGMAFSGTMSLGQTFEGGDYEVSVRRLFIPRKGFRLYFLDYSQMEMRVFSDYVQDESLAELLESETFDFHSHVAKTVWHASEDQKLWDFYRTLAKAVNFGLIYGIGVKKLALQIGKTVEEARKYREEYFSRFPKAQAFIAKVQEVIEIRGFIFNKFKRRYWVDPNRSYVGVNYLVQGSSADIVKNRMVACQKYIREHKLKSRMLAQVHDEIIFEIHESEESWVAWEFKRILEERQIETYLPVEITRGCPSWAQKESWSTKELAWKAK